ncbi:hypothetical protein VTL71DRAFT_15944 [Oculimacula yallundae]|uniref:Uncharacterized protein n=1 Tax=Oculimacula yallundae TaxID=86028 RepID=A0ABR4CF55_9HELO
MDNVTQAVDAGQTAQQGVLTCDPVGPKFHTNGRSDALSPRSFPKDRRMMHLVKVKIKEKEAVVRSGRRRNFEQPRVQDDLGSSIACSTAGQSSVFPSLQLVTWNLPRCLIPLGHVTAPAKALRHQQRTESSTVTQIGDNAISPVQIPNLYATSPLRRTRADQVEADSCTVQSRLFTSPLSHRKQQKCKHRSRLTGQHSTDLQWNDILTKPHSASTHPIVSQQQISAPSKDPDTWTRSSSRHAELANNLALRQWVSKSERNKATGQEARSEKRTINNKDHT